MMSFQIKFFEASRDLDHTRRAVWSHFMFMFVFFYSLFCFLRLKTSLHLLELFPKDAALLPHCQKWMVNRLFYFSVNYSSKGETVSFIPLTLSHRVKIEKQLTMGMPAWVHCANCLFVFVLIWKVSHYLIVLSNSVALSVGKSRPRKSVDS